MRKCKLSVDIKMDVYECFRYQSLVLDASEPVMALKQAATANPPDKLWEFGARDGIRTRDFLLGKQTFYR